MEHPVAVITGSTRGLGAALADALLAQGARVVVSGRDPAAVERAITSLASQHGADRVRGLAGDVARYADCAALWTCARDAFGRVDVWINNAGLGGRPAAFSEQAADDVGPVVAVNLIGAMNGTHVALAGMRAQGSGKIFNVEGFGSNPTLRRTGMAVYGATKCAVRYFTRSIVDETRGGPVVVATIVPGVVVTDMLREQAAAAPSRRGFYEAVAETPATAAAFLAPRLLGEVKHGGVVACVTLPGLIARLLTPSRRRRGLFAAP